MKEVRENIQKNPKKKYMAAILYLTEHSELHVGRIWASTIAKCMVG